MPNLRSADNRRQRCRLHVNGIVQGVGFRPFVFNLARNHKLSGFVSNTSQGVIIEVEGPADAVQTFQQALQTQAPPLSEITSLDQETIPLQHSTRFEIRTSLAGSDNQTLISPDTATCPDCLGELFDPGDRRYLYPFINCTNCGPRFTIIKKVPYDRPLTSMSGFTMCPRCQAEYDDPANRRFHAQPNACPVCGPHIWYEEAGSGHLLAQHGDVIDLAVQDLLAGKVLAIRGLGGFHLAVDAGNDTAVLELRRRKNREEKPLAVMLPDLESVRRAARSTSSEELELTGSRRPIVLLCKNANSGISENVAPGNRRLGVMLPYTPLHHILLKKFAAAAGAKSTPALIMTSANLSEEPIVTGNDEARRRLARIADRLLLHNREILYRADDSVVFFPTREISFIRRSRGFVPRPVFLKSGGEPILAVGGELKNTVCFLKQERAFLSQHIGDLENLLANKFFEETIGHLAAVLEIDPQVLACDRHPGYFSTQWAEKQTGKRLFKIQHHHAHLAACLAEHQHQGPALGVILDGTGYGCDQTIWGGEIVMGDFTSLSRRAWLQPLPLAGGDQAVRQPWRIAAGYLHSLFGGRLPDLPCFDGKAVDIIGQMIDKGINTVLTSSCGRLFDAVAALGGGRQEIRYEAQAAIELMQAVRDIDVPAFDYELTDSGPVALEVILKSVIRAVQNGQSFEQIAARFHRTLIDLFSGLAGKQRQATGINTVVLSGGVFQNEILLRELTKSLERMKFNVLTHRLIPANDGGISLGQAVVARQLLHSGRKDVDYNQVS